MKKLLTVLSLISVSVVSVGSVVSCQKEKGNKTFLDENGELNFNSESIINWYKNWIGLNKEALYEQTARFYNYFSVGILKAAQEGKLDNKTSDSFNEDTLKEMKKILGNPNDSADEVTIYGMAKRAYNERKEHYKKDEKGFRKELNKKFPHVKDEWSCLEKAYKSDFILNDSANSAYIKIKNLLMFDNATSSSNWKKTFKSQQVNWKTYLIKDFYEEYKDTKNHEELVKAIKNSFETITDFTQRKLTSFINIINALGGLHFKETAQINFSTGIEIKNAIKNDDKLIENILKISTGKSTKPQISHFDDNWIAARINDEKLNNVINYKGEKLTSWDSVTKDIPIIISNGEFSTENDLFNNNYGLISDTQKAALNDYFVKEKPVAISDLVLSFKNSVTWDKVLENGLNIKAFLPLFNKSEDLDATTKMTQWSNGINSILSTYMKSNTKDENEKSQLTRFDTIFKGSSPKIWASQVEKIVSKPDKNTWYKWDEKNDHHAAIGDNKSKLITISSSDSVTEIAKSSIYNFISNNENKSSFKFESDNGEIKHINDLKNDLKLLGLNESEIGSLSFVEDNEKILNSIKNLIKLFKSIRQSNAKLENQIKKGDLKDADVSENFENVYTIMNNEDGIISYIDKDGLHFTKIDGFNLLKLDRNDSKQDKRKDIKEAQILKTINALYSGDGTKSSSGNNIVPFLLNSINKNADSAEKNDEWIWEDKDVNTYNKLKNIGITNQEMSYLNYKIENKYAQFLINNSLISKDKLNDISPFYSFNLLDKVATSIGTASNTNANWNLKFFANLFGDNDNYKKIISTILEDNGENAISYISEISRIIENKIKEENAYTFRELLSQNMKHISTIEENYKKLVNKSINDPNFDFKFVPNQAIRYNVKNEDKPILDRAFDVINNSYFNFKLNSTFTSNNYMYNINISDINFKNNKKEKR